MYFEAYPPEVNSGNMLAGPGFDSMQAAAAAWRLLGKEMLALQVSFSKILEGLQQQWMGPAATQVVDAATPFAKWLADLSKQIYEARRQTARLCDAFFYAHDQIVRPDAIADNREERKMLTIKNAFGRYDAEIANLGQEYENFWQQDGQVIRDYRHIVLNALSRLAPWPSPPPIANTGLVQPVLPSSSLFPVPVRTT